jgi:hypothetical protein
MLGLVLAAMSAVHPPAAPPVELADAYGFGLCHEVAAANHRTADTHRWTMGAVFVKELPYWQFNRWTAHQDWRRECWRLLETALDPTIKDEVREDALDQLRDLLGGDDYWDRRMPMPLPSYRR